MNVSMLNYLIDVGVLDGVAILFAIIYFVLRSIKSAKTVNEVKTTAVAPQVPVVPVRKSRIAAVVNEPKAVPQKVVLPPDDGLGVLVETARKNADKCSVCAAYVIFYDKGRFKAEGMTASGMMAHFDASHKQEIIMDMYQKAWQRLLKEVQKKTGWGNVELQKLMLDCLLNPDKDVK